jgi:poly [ADP-ribose] polymerase 7/11/12/13
VLVGESEVGSQNMVRPPPKPNGKLYDSCVDSLTNPSIFVTFDCADAYPEYLIEYE